MLVDGFFRRFRNSITRDALAERNGNEVNLFHEQLERTFFLAINTLNQLLRTLVRGMRVKQNKSGLSPNFLLRWRRRFIPSCLQHKKLPDPATVQFGTNFSFTSPHRWPETLGRKRFAPNSSGTSSDTSFISNVLRDASLLYRSLNSRLKQ